MFLVCTIVAMTDKTTDPMVRDTGLKHAHLRIKFLMMERRTKDIPLYVLFLDAVKHEFCKKYATLS